MSSQMTFSCQKGEGNLKHNYDIEYRKELKHVDSSIANIELIPTEDIKKVYQELFGDALAEYNAKQKRNDRKIFDYHEHVLNDGKTNEFNEIILTAGNMDDGVADETKIEILKAMFTEFKEKYKSNIRVFGAVIHLDEIGAPHLHIDYIAYVDKDRNQDKTKKTNGLKRKVNQDEAYRQLGFKPEKSYINGTDKPPIIFNGFRNDIARMAERIYQQHGIDVLHIKSGKDHQSVTEYTDSQKYDELMKQMQEKLDTLQTEKNQLKGNVKALEAKFEEYTKATDTFVPLNPRTLRKPKHVTNKVYYNLEEHYNRLYAKWTTSENTVQALRTRLSASEAYIDVLEDIPSVKEIKALESANLSLQREMEQKDAVIKDQNGKIEELEGTLDNVLDMLNGFVSFAKTLTAEWLKKMYQHFTPEHQQVIREQMDKTSALQAIYAKGTRTEKTHDSEKEYVPER